MWFGLVKSIERIFGVIFDISFSCGSFMVLIGLVILWFLLLMKFDCIMLLSIY